MVVITGVSGSGKSSLAFETLNKEGQRRFMASFSSYARQFLQKMSAPDVDRIEGLSPALSIDQKTVVQNPRSTVGTLSELNDALRLLFARLGEGSDGRPSSHFSFNSPHGACVHCKGLGVEDRVDPNLLIGDPSKTIREGALVLTTPTGYLVYSQVTLDVLNQVCQAHGFDVDIPWRDLTQDQRDIVLFGSNRIKIAFGKHPLENRLKWSGITAKPREEGYYKGILPVMQDILKRDRNKNILRFVRSVTCSVCGGARLRPESLNVLFQGLNFAGMTALSMDELHAFFENPALKTHRMELLTPIREEILNRTVLLRELGLGYLTLDRESTSLSGGEAQRIRLVNQIVCKLQGVLYVLDEPSIGLHPSDNQRLINALIRLKDMGNTLVIVEHDEETMLTSDWIVDLGPGAGTHGGRVLFSGPPSVLIKEHKGSSATGAFLAGTRRIEIPSMRRSGTGELVLECVSRNNLNGITPKFKLGALNVVTGVSGSGKSTLVKGVLSETVSSHLCGEGIDTSNLRQARGLDQIGKLIEITQAPIGRTPRSNPATYTKMFDAIRDLFSKTEKARSLGFGKGRFSFNNKGGRCEDCGGAGLQRVGMHFLEDVFIVCDTCHGKRFNEETLSIQYKGLNIHQVLELTIDLAADFFADHSAIMRYITTLQKVGLGYLKLGQPSTTLSGGEAQRVKLASQLARPASGNTLFLLDEPTIGLHGEDIIVLLKALNELVQAGHTIIVIEHHPSFILSADHVVDLGPGSGKLGGNIVVQGTPEDVAQHPDSVLAPFLRAAMEGKRPPVIRTDQNSKDRTEGHISIRGARTHNLKNVDVTFKHGELTVITGVSGSGKSSLAFNTLYAQGRRMFFQSMSSFARRYFKQLPGPDIDFMTGMSPTISIGHQRSKDNPRSVVATSCGVYDLFRLLYSRGGKVDGASRHFPARMFSFNHHSGSCQLCRGLGVETVCDPRKLVSHPDRSLFQGALSGTKPGSFYGDPDGQYMATLQSVAEQLNLDLSPPWNELSEEARHVAMHGTGDREWNVLWRFKRKGRKGEHLLKTKWPGFCGHVEEEYRRVHADHRGAKLKNVMMEIPCKVCGGERLGEESRQVTLAGRRLPELLKESIEWNRSFFQDLLSPSDTFSSDPGQSQLIKPLRRDILNILDILSDVGLGYLSLERRTSSLSGGERQRLRLTGALGGGMCGVTYVFDEPTLGLHGRDTDRLIGVLKKLRDQGNTVVVVEHDESIIRSADHIIDMGPGAGTDGGKIVARGSAARLMKSDESLTGKYLSGTLVISGSFEKRVLEDGIHIGNAWANNLHIPHIHIPRGGIIAISGVSGSGKSSLLFDVLLKSSELGSPAGCDAIDGLNHFTGIHLMDQAPVGTTPLSNLLTFCGLFDPIRKRFARQPEAVSRGLKPAAFSFNSKAGRCESCSGMGQHKVEMGFLADVWVPCEVCDGRRYKSDILEVELRGKNILQILELTVRTAIRFFEDEPKLIRGLNVLDDVGLGYLTLGQASNTLSGGEIQRLKLAKALLDAQKGETNALYVFDEPTTGLHFDDVRRLLNVFRRLTASGHTVLVIEHHLDIIAASDWVIDLGPEGGSSGGELVVAGTPETVSHCTKSWTGRLLGLTKSSSCRNM